ncbi:MAG: COX15/CtaA family protein [Pseudomonadota bacterium]
MHTDVAPSPHTAPAALRTSAAATLYKRLLPIATALALGVVVLGAWVRLTDAGLGCPDWPGCYGTLTVPSDSAEIASATAAYPERPVETQKAWNEMIHRYFAGTLGLLVLAIFIAAWRARRHDPDHPFYAPLFLGGLITFQAALGMWTVTLLLKPVIVMMHLLGGMSTLGLLFWLTLRAWRRGVRQPLAPTTTLATAALVLVFAQIALGGWTSTNYAALACPDLPTCQGEWWPEADFSEGFVLWRGVGIDYEGGVLDGTARTAIHLTHRIGAIAVTIGLLLLLTHLLRNAATRLRAPAVIMAAALTLQICIGIGIIEWSLPLWLATSHNAGGALLLLAMLYLNYESRYVQS